VDELVKQKSLPIITVVRKQFFTFAMDINSLSVSCHREIIRSEVTGELDVLAKETAGLTQGSW
jgi:hypothetical protein